jgi:hypothetical protein
MKIKLSDILNERLESDLWRRGGGYGLDLRPIAHEIGSNIDKMKQIDTLLYKAARAYGTSRSTDTVYAYFLDIQQILKEVSKANATIRSSINDLTRSRGKTY